MDLPGSPMPRAFIIPLGSCTEFYVGKPRLKGLRCLVSLLTYEKSKDSITFFLAALSSDLAGNGTDAWTP